MRRAREKREIKASLGRHLAARMVEDEPAPPAVIVRGRDRLREMVDAHFEFVWRLLRAFGVPESQADDGAQQVFLIASKKLERIAVGSERSFLFATARGVSANVRRAVSRRREQTDEDALARELDHAPTPEEAYERVEAKDTLATILAGMDEGSRAVFVLFDIEGLTTTEISVLLTVPMGTVASRLRRAREHFEREAKRLQSEIEGTS